MLRDTVVRVKEMSKLPCRFGYRWMCDCLSYSSWVVANDSHGTPEHESFLMRRTGRTCLLCVVRDTLCSPRLRLCYNYSTQRRCRSSEKDIGAHSSTASISERSECNGKEI